jgi:hypothetical protein
VSQGQSNHNIYGLIRSYGGWTTVKQMRRAKMFEKSDEHIPGDGDFVEQMEKRNNTLQARGYDLDKLASRVCDLMQVEPA